MTTISSIFAPAPSPRSGRRDWQGARGPRLPPSFTVSFQGAALRFIRAVERSVPAPAAIAAMYIVLGVLYDSFIHPITILTTLPSAGHRRAVDANAAGGRARHHRRHRHRAADINIVKKNAIMMIDFALDAQREQRPAAREAIYQACLLRLRPILMTTVAAIFGALPLMLGTGVGSELRRPLGLAIVGGLAFSQVLTLYTTRRSSICSSSGSASASAWARRGPRSLRKRREQPLFRALHSPAGGDDPAHDRHHLRRAIGLFATSGFAVAASRLPGHLGPGEYARREPGHDGGVGRGTA